MSARSHPLQWPSHRPRKPAGARKVASFGKKQDNGRWLETKRLTVADAIDRLQEELDRLRARYPVISSNLETRLDGRPRSGQAEPSDPGVALYFDLDGKPHCMPCDTYTRVADNIAAIAKHIKATRDIDRFGVANVAEMFTGFQALPAPGAQRSWRDVFGFAPEQRPSLADIDRAYKTLAKERHPDVYGGSAEAMAELNHARDEAIAHVRDAA